MDDEIKTEEEKWWTKIKSFNINGDIYVISKVDLSFFGEMAELIENKLSKK